MLNIAEVAELLGPEIKPKTISTYLTESRAEVGRGEKKRRGRYADHPFPAPNGYYRRAPWWAKERAEEIRRWAEGRPGQGSRTDLP